MDYQKLYYLLFNAYDDVINHIEQHNFGLAQDILIKTHQEAEELYLEQED